MGDVELGKTPALCAFARVLSFASQDEGSEKYYLATSQLDALRYTQHLLTPGTSIVFDEWAPSTARGGRTKHVTREEALAAITTHTPQTLPSRFGDTRVSTGARLFCHNSTSLVAWHPDLVDGIEEMSDDQRRNLPAPRNAIFKRLCFAFVRQALVPQDEAAVPYWEGKLEEHAKRMRLAEGLYTRASAGSASSLGPRA